MTKRKRIDQRQAVCLLQSAFVGGMSFVGVEMLMNLADEVSEKTGVTPDVIKEARNIGRHPATLNPLIDFTFPGGRSGYDASVRSWRKIFRGKSPW